MSVSELQRILNSIGQYCNQSAFWINPFRWIGWKLVRGLQWVCDGAEGLLNTVYGLFGFVYTESVKEFIESYRPILWIVFAAALMILGYNLIINRDAKPKVFETVMLMICFLTVTPLLLPKLMNFTNQAIGTVDASYANSSDTIIKNGLVDLRYLDKNNFKTNKGLLPNNIQIKYIDPTERVYCDDSSLKHQDFFRYTLTVGADGKLTTKEFKFGGITGWLEDTTYYRFHIDFVSIYITLIATILVLFFTAYKVARILFELAFNHFFGFILAPADLMTGERLKKIMKSMASMIAVLFFTIVVLKFYFLFSAYISSKVSNQFYRALILLFAALAAIDGPNIVESCLGIDVGLKSGFQSMTSLFMASQTLHHFGSNMKNAAEFVTRPVREGAGRGIGHGAAALAGHFGGFNADSGGDKVPDSAGTSGSGNPFNSNNAVNEESSDGGVHGFSAQGDTNFDTNNSSVGMDSTNRDDSSNTNSSSINSSSATSSESSSNMDSSVSEAGSQAPGSESGINAETENGPDIGNGQFGENSEDFAQTEMAEEVASAGTDFAQTEMAAEKQNDNSTMPDKETNESESAQQSQQNAHYDENSSNRGQAENAAEKRTEANTTVDDAKAAQKQSNLNSTQGFNGQQQSSPTGIPDANTSHIGSQTIPTQPQKGRWGLIHGIRKGYQAGKKSAIKNKTKNPKKKK